MPLYTLNRDYTLRTVDGVISFTKGEPTWVTQAMVRHAVSIGAEPKGGDKPELINSAVSTKPALSHDERRTMIFLAFEQIESVNDTKDFTGAGVPTVKAVEKLTEFDVDRVEITEAWAEYRASKAE